MNEIIHNVFLPTVTSLRDKQHGVITLFRKTSAFRDDLYDSVNRLAITSLFLLHSASLCSKECVENEKIRKK